MHVNVLQRMHRFKVRTRVRRTRVLRGLGVPQERWAR